MKDKIKEMLCRLELVDEESDGCVVCLGEKLPKEDVETISEFITEKVIPMVIKPNPNIEQVDNGFNVRNFFNNLNAKLPEHYEMVLVEGDVSNCVVIPFELQEIKELNRIVIRLTLALSKDDIEE